MKRRAKSIRGTAAIKVARFWRRMTIAMLFPLAAAAGNLVATVRWALYPPVQFEDVTHLIHVPMPRPLRLIRDVCPRCVRVPPSDQEV